MVIEEMMFDLMPPRETFTTLSYDKVSKKCAEIENARIQQIEASRNSKYFLLNYKRANSFFSPFANPERLCRSQRLRYGSFWL